MMQHNNPSEPSRFGKFFQEKGYYIVLFLCILAVGISGYIFISNAVSEKNSLTEDTLSVAATAKTDETERREPQSTQPQPVKPVMEALTETPVSALPDPDEAVREAAAQVHIWPLSGGSVHDYSMAQLSYNVTTRDWRTHDGVDLAAEAGTPVMAACAGTVSAVYDDEYFGATVVVTHADGYTTRYSNLDANARVYAGDVVAAGDVIGTVGSTALLESGEESHLHFAVYHDGEPVDPAEYIG